MLNLTATEGSLIATPASVAINVQSATQQVADLRTRVIALRTAGVLSNTRAKSLLVNLELSGAKNDISKIQAFLRMVQAYRSAHILTPEQANSLLLPGNILLLSLTRR